MTCPTCGKHFDEDIHVCPICDTPIANAVYVPIPRKEKKARHFIFPTLLLLLLVAGAAGYYSYQLALDRIAQLCEEETESIFKAVETKDFSNLTDTEVSLLPSFLLTEESVSSTVSEEIEYLLEDGTLNTWLEQDSSLFPFSKVKEALNDKAVYQIESSSASWNSCDVTVTSGNIDLSQFTSSLSEAVEENLQTDSTLWESITETVKDLFFGQHHEEERIHKAIEKTLGNHCEEYLENAPYKEYTGTLRFTRTKDGWKIQTIDENLLRVYYGLQTRK